MEGSFFRTVALRRASFHAAKFILNSVTFSARGLSNICLAKFLYRSKKRIEAMTGSVFTRLAISTSELIMNQKYREAGLRSRGVVVACGHQSGVECTSDNRYRTLWNLLISNLAHFLEDGSIDLALAVDGEILRNRIGSEIPRPLFFSTSNCIMLSFW